MKITCLSFLIAFFSFSTLASDLASETLSDFKKRTCNKPGPIAGTQFASWNILVDEKKYYVSFPAYSSFGRATKPGYLPTWIASPDGSVRIAVAVFTTQKSMKPFQSCATLGKHLWNSACLNKACQFSDPQTVKTDGRSYQSHSTKIRIKHKGQKAEFPAIYQCSIGKETTISLMAVLVAPYKSIKNTEDLALILKNFNISRAK